jgi:hypothetical protein
MFAGSAAAGRARVGYFTFCENAHARRQRDDVDGFGLVDYRLDSFCVLRGIRSADETSVLLPN